MTVIILYPLQTNYTIIVARVTSVITSLLFYAITPANGALFLFR